MSRQRAFLVIIFLGLSMLLAVQQQRISQLQQDAIKANATSFRQQLKQGYACGLLTSNEASVLLEQKEIFTNGTIIPADSPTAGVRQGSPRLDSCSHGVGNTNTSYIDIIVKTYDNPQQAAEAYKNDMSKVLYSEPGGLNIEGATDTYSSGAHYILKDNVVYEISASKVGSSSGSDLRHFSDKVALQIMQKV